MWPKCQLVHLGGCWVCRQSTADQHRAVVQFLYKKCCKEMHHFSLFHREFHLATEVWQHPMEVQIQPPKFWECQNGCCYPNVWLCLGETHGEIMVLMAGFRVPHFVDLAVANVLQIPWLDRIGIPSLIQPTLEQRLPSALLRTFNLGAGRSWHVDTGGKLAGHRIKNSLDLFGSTRSSGVRVLSKLSWMVVPMWLDMRCLMMFGKDCLENASLMIYLYILHPQERDAKSIFNTRPDFGTALQLTNAVPFAARWPDKARGYIFWPGIWVVYGGITQPDLEVIIVFCLKKNKR